MAKRYRWRRNLSKDDVQLSDVYQAILAIHL
ncbi:hypothetical protein wcw_0235 [Waddlia chondrophila WSU 86-1044]|uniref:Uncharacterized protein n=1 Tax=Waddlia chondrophila (strain ATCC VR-1470 / WSU 86-1044) TaxID=716544 RepID=D6YTZ9_WADCW|nr:hypothetical protein wcw_0235 [Waddlia chondrophila WSU 86-1044]